MAPIDLDPYRAPRPHRADAARNFDAILEAARVLFTERGVDVPLEAVAERAGIGIATLYRSFPTREVLVENVYIVEIQAVRAEADASLELAPGDGLTIWLRRFVEYVGTKRAIATAIDHESAVYRACFAALAEAGTPLLRRAQASGDLRTDVDDDDIGRYDMGVDEMNVTSEQRHQRLLGLMFDSLRAPSAHSGS